MAGHGGNRTYDVWNTSPIKSSLILAYGPTGGRQSTEECSVLRPPLHEPGLIFNPGQHATGGYFFILFT